MKGETTSFLFYFLIPLSCSFLFSSVRDRRRELACDFLLRFSRIDSAPPRLCEATSKVMMLSSPTDLLCGAERTGTRSRQALKMGRTDSTSSRRCPPQNALQNGKLQTQDSSPPHSPHPPPHAVPYSNLPPRPLPLPSTSRPHPHLQQHLHRLDHKHKHAAAAEAGPGNPQQNGPAPHHDYFPLGRPRPGRDTPDRMWRGWVVGWTSQSRWAGSSRRHRHRRQSFR